LISRHARRFR